MAHGNPDFGQSAQKQTVYGVLDLGELAARLGSIVRFDRRGYVMHLDSFESGITSWEHITHGADSSVAPSSLRSRTGGVSCALVTGADNGDYSQIRRHFPYPRLGRFGFEISFCTDDEPSYHTLQIGLYTGSYLKRASIQYVPSTGVWKLSTGGAYSEITTKAMILTSYLFHTVKLVGNFSDMEYTRLIIDDEQFDISGIDLAESASGVSPYMFVDYFIITGGGAKIVYLDDAIITQNEPE